MTDTLIDPANVEMPSENGPLERYTGSAPAAPGWFDRALSVAGAEHGVEVDGTEIRYKVWGPTDAPGLLLVHGNGAHHHWWDFVAPALAQTHRVAAITLGGMGDSGWRDSYRLEMFGKELLGVAQAAGLFASPATPQIIAHSFGGMITLGLVAKAGDRFGQAIIIDSPVAPPGEGMRKPPRSGRPNKLYPDLTSALARFRLAPPQPCENHFAMDYIARHSLTAVVEGHTTIGWRWKFDPHIWDRFDTPAEPSKMLPKAKCKLAFIRGADSLLVNDRVFEYMRSISPPGTPFVSIAGAHHHVMLDQPLALIAALNALVDMPGS